LPTCPQVTDCLRVLFDFFTSCDYPIADVKIGKT